MRAEMAHPGRVVVKVGSSSLTTADGAFDIDRVQSLARELSALRARGARVVLLDDLRATDDEVAARLQLLRAETVAALGRAGAGDGVTVRLLPPGRDLLATLSVVGDAGQRRREFDLTGAVRP